MAAPGALLVLWTLAAALLVPSEIPTTLLESADPLTGEASRWEGWTSVVRASGLPEGARASLVDALGAELPGSSDVATGGVANLSIVHRFPGVLRLALNRSPAGDAVLLNGSFAVEPPLHFGRREGPLWAELCVSSVRNSEGRAIPDASREGIPVTLDSAGARTDATGCALLPAPRRNATANLSGLGGPELLPGREPDGPLFSFISAGGRATEFFTKGPLRAVTVAAARDLANFTLVVEQRPDGSLGVWSRRPLAGVSGILLTFDASGAVRFCPRERPGCSPARLPSAVSWDSMLVSLPNYGYLQIDATNESLDTTVLFVLSIGVVASVLLLLSLGRRRKR